MSSVYSKVQQSAAAVVGIGISKMDIEGLKAMTAAALALMIYATVIGRFLVSPTGGILLFLTVIALTPRYIGFGVGEAGFALSAQRMLSISIIVVLIAALVTKRITRQGEQNYYSPDNFLKITLLYFGISTIASILNAGGGYHFVLSLFENLVYLLIPFIFIYYLYPANGSTTKFLFFVFLIPVFLSFIFAASELISQRPIFSGIQNQSITSLHDFGEGKFRDGTYRAKALFDGPLIFSEFSVYAWVSILFLWNNYEKNKKNTRAISRVSLLIFGTMALFCVYSTGSRAGLVILILSTLCYLFISKSRQLMKSKSTYRLIRFCIVVGIITILCFIFWVISKFTQVGSFSEIQNQFDRSNYARTLQYIQSQKIASESPIFGHGYQRNFSESFDKLHNLDNHYLRSLIQSGYVGLLLFISTIFIVIGAGIRMIYSNNRRVIAVGVFLITFGIAFLLQKQFLSQPNNNIYLYIVFFISCKRANFLLNAERSASNHDVSLRRY